MLSCWMVMTLIACAAATNVIIRLVVVTDGNLGNHISIMGPYSCLRVSRTNVPGASSLDECQQCLAFSHRAVLAS